MEITMARGINRLSPAKGQKLKRKGIYGDGAGLWLQVREGKSGPTKSWLFKYAINGRERACGLGPLYTIGLAKARELAREARELRLEHKDPIEVKRAVASTQRLEAAKAMTFEECAAAYLRDHAPTWRTTTIRNGRATTLRDYAYPVIRQMLVRDIDTTMVLLWLEPH